MSEWRRINIDTSYRCRLDVPTTKYRRINVRATSWRRIDADTTPCQHHVPAEHKYYNIYENDLMLLSLVRDVKNIFKQSLISVSFSNML